MEQHDSGSMQREKQIEEAGDSLCLVLISWAVRDAFSNTQMSTTEAEEADERRRNPAVLILLIQPSPLKNTHPSSAFALTPPQTGKPLLNNIIVCLILTVTSTREEKKPD